MTENNPLIKKEKKSHRRGGFTFKQFFVAHDQCAMKVGTDGVLLGAWAPLNQAKRVLDIGTGSGLVALMLAQRSAMNAVQIDAVELDDAAAKQAQSNFDASPWGPYLACHQADIVHFTQQAKADNTQYDLIVSNPPYFEPACDCRDNARNTARYTESLTHKTLLECADTLLASSGLFCVVLPYDIGTHFAQLAQSKGWSIAQQVNIKDSDNKAYHRVLLALNKKQASIESQQETQISALTLKNSAGEYSNIFRHWISDFYLYY